MRRALFIAFGLVGLGVAPCAAQGNYEVQVYGSETLAPKKLMLELHSNFTISGIKEMIDGVIPTGHAIHETFEVTQGISSWFETGFYAFTSYNSGYGWQYVGSHIRPRVRAPESWHWPVGVGLSAEFGYQRPNFSLDTWTLELRPIVDKELGKWYLCFNPTLDRSFHGPSVSQGVGFSPNGKFSYKLSKRIQGGLEYYGSLGPVTGFDSLRDQMQMVLPAVDVDLGENWELNFGLGVGMTSSTDHLLMKVIVGRRFSTFFGRRSRSRD